MITLLSLMSLYLQLYLTVADITEKYFFKVHCILKFHNLLYESDHDHELFCISTTVSDFENCVALSYVLFTNCNGSLICILARGTYIILSTHVISFDAIIHVLICSFNSRIACPLGASAL